MSHYFAVIAAVYDGDGNRERVCIATFYQFRAYSIYCNHESVQYKAIYRPQ